MRPRSSPADRLHGPTTDADPSLVEGSSPPQEAVAHTGTTTVALAAADAAVLAADRRASLGGRVVSNKRTRKVEAVHPTAAVSLSGAVGSLQRFARSLRSEVALYGTRRDGPPSVDALSTLAGTLLRAGPYRGLQLSLGGVDTDGPKVFDLDAGGGVLQADYVAGGSGMGTALGLLEDRYEPGMDAGRATAVAARAVAAASERDTASGNGIALAEVTADGVEIREHDGLGAALDAVGRRTGEAGEAS